MPYDQGVRISNEEYQWRYSNTRLLHTGPNGENPADAPENDPVIGAPKSQKKEKPESTRTPRSEASAKAAIADALGVADDSPVLEDIDVSGLDAVASDADAEAPIKKDPLAAARAAKAAKKAALAAAKENA